MTAPDLEGQGIGSALLSAIEERLADVDKFVLSTGTKSALNIAMYERHGYVKERESVDAAGINIVVMSKSSIKRQ
jgi:ribosomal protein S18 acetylase RimI-like enzyme